MNETIDTGVYCWRNLINGKVYVGSTGWSFDERKQKHINLLSHKKHPNRHLQGAWSTYGDVAFVFEILEVCPPEQCVEREQFWMDKIHSADQRFGYNICTVAGSCMGVTRSPETRAKMAAAKIGNKHGVGHKNSAVDIERIRNLNLGKRFTEEHIKNLTAARRKRRVKLSTDDVFDVRRRLAAGEPQATIARSKGISVFNVSNIKAGRVFGWL